MALQPLRSPATSWPSATRVGREDWTPLGATKGNVEVLIDAILEMMLSGDVIIRDEASTKRYNVKDFSTISVAELGGTTRPGVGRGLSPAAHCAGMRAAAGAEERTRSSLQPQRGSSAPQLRPTPGDPQWVPVHVQRASDTGPVDRFRGVRRCPGCGQSSGRGTGTQEHKSRLIS